MFSYLTSTMTQAQDVAAVLNHGSENASGAFVIADTLAAHDTLAIEGVTKALLQANPADSSRPQ
jgi:hypothetical protein